MVNFCPPKWMDPRFSHEFSIMARAQGAVAVALLPVTKNHSITDIFWRTDLDSSIPNYSVFSKTWKELRLGANRDTN